MKLSCRHCDVDLDGLKRKCKRDGAQYQLSAAQRSELFLDLLEVQSDDDGPSAEDDGRAAPHLAVRPHAGSEVPPPVGSDDHHHRLDVGRLDDSQADPFEDIDCE